MLLKTQLSTPLVNKSSCDHKRRDEVFLLAAELFRLLIQTAPQDLEIGPFGRQFSQSQFELVFTHLQCVSLRLLIGR